MCFNQFHAAEPKEGRSAADVFASSSTVQSSGISSRFASSGKFTAKQLDDGDVAFVSQARQRVQATQQNIAFVRISKCTGPGQRHG